MTDLKDKQARMTVLRLHIESLSNEYDALRREVVSEMSKPKTQPSVKGNSKKVEA